MGAVPHATIRRRVGIIAHFFYDCWPIIFMIVVIMRLLLCSVILIGLYHQIDLAYWLLVLLLVVVV